MNNRPPWLLKTTHLLALMLICFTSFTQVPTELIRPIIEEPKISEYDAYNNSAYLNWGIDYYQLESLISKYPGEDLRICICDTGEPIHSDLTDAFGGSINFSRDLTVVDGNGHSTHVAGIIHEILPQAKLYYAKVLADDGFGNTSLSVKGVAWCDKQNTDFINMSLGSSYEDLELLEAIQSYQENGGMVFAAAGNSGYEPNQDNIKYPAKWPIVKAIGSHDRWGNVSSFSSGGEGGFLIFPGSGITSTYVDDEIDNPYAALSGTSMACPFALALSGLYKQKYPNRFSKTAYMETHWIHNAYDILPLGYDPISFYGRPTMDMFSSDKDDVNSVPTPNVKPKKPPKWGLIVAILSAVAGGAIITIRSR